MVAASDQRKTVKQVINEVRRKLNTSTVTDLTDTLSTAYLDYLNDVVADMADYGDWQELQVDLVSAVTCTAGVSEYSLRSSGAVVQNVNELVFRSNTNRTDIAPMRFWKKDDLRRVSRTSAQGHPRFWTTYGTDTCANPIVKVYPTPGTNESQAALDALIYQKPPLYDASASSTTIPFPSRPVVQGLYAMALLDEAGGVATQRYAQAFQLYETMKSDAYNRYNGDSSTDTHFTPSYGPTY